MQTLRNFLISFGVGLVVFTLLAFLIVRSLGLGGRRVGTLDSIAFPSVEADASPSDEAPSVRSVNGFTMVVGGVDDRGTLSLLLLFQADRVNERFMLSAVPTALRVRVPDESGSLTLTTLRELPIRFEGPTCKQMVLQTVTQITGLEPDYYLFLDREKALELFNLTGGLYFDVPETLTDIGSGTPEAPEVFIDRGGQVLGKQRIVQLLTFENYGLDAVGNSVRCAAVQADFIDQALLQLGNFEDTTVNRIASQMLGESDTDFSYDDYEFYADLLDCYSDYRVRNTRVYWDASDPIEEAYSKAMFESYLPAAQTE